MGQVVGIKSLEGLVRECLGEFMHSQEHSRERSPFNSISLGTSAINEKMRDRAYCLNSRGSLKVVSMIEGRAGQIIYRGFHTNMTCKQWNCPVCAQKLLTVLIKRLWEGNLYKRAVGYWLEGKKWRTKFLTLTLPGEEYRQMKTVEEMVDDLQRNFKRLKDALRRKYGWIDYFWVIQFQSDGTPHLHVLLVGDGIWPKDILPYVRGLWCDKYGMGYLNVRARRAVRRAGVIVGYEVMRSPKEIVNYMVRYMGYGIAWLGKNRKNFGSSKGALAREIDIDNQRVLMVQPLPYTVQTERGSGHGDMVEEFRVLGSGQLREHLSEFFRIKCPAEYRAAIKKAEEENKPCTWGKIYRGKVAREVYNELIHNFPGEELPKLKRIE